MQQETIPPKYKKVLDKLRDLWIQSGGKPPYRPEDFGLNHYGKSEEGMEIDFDYGVPHHLFTPEGYYTILGSCTVGDTDKFWKLLNGSFEVTIVKPKRDDSKISELDFQLQPSLPLVRIREREEPPEEVYEQIQDWLEKSETRTLELTMSRRAWKHIEDFSHENKLTLDAAIEEATLAIE